VRAFVRSVVRSVVADEDEGARDRVEVLTEVSLARG
jgi:hypothetical protein